MLPAMPFVLSKIMECVDDPLSSAADLKRIILEDQAITAKVLSLANSAAYGQEKRVTDVARAVVIVGFHTVYQLAAGASLANSLGKDLTSSELDLFEFWKYSVACGESARRVAEISGYGAKEQAYMFGLLHDLGKLILLRLFKAEYEDVLFMARAEGQPLHEAELARFEFDHTDAGRWLGQQWKLPGKILPAITFHHTLNRVPEEAAREIFLCHVAEYLARTARVGQNGDGSPPVLHDRSASLFGMTASRAHAQVQWLQKRAPAIEAMTKELVKPQ